MSECSLFKLFPNKYMVQIFQGPSGHVSIALEDSGIDWLERAHRIAVFLLTLERILFASAAS